MGGANIVSSVAPDQDPASVDVPVGGYVCSASAVSFDMDRPVTQMKVRNTGDRPIQVGSHFLTFSR